MRFQRQLSNGAWIDEDNIDYQIDEVLKRETWLAPREGREPLTTREQVVAKLGTLYGLRYGDDWYLNIRDADALPQPKPRPEPEMVRCACGHSVPRDLVMSASRGTSCPDCYDRMSV